jgi:hypothetical protein
VGIFKKGAREQVPASEDARFQKQFDASTQNQLFHPAFYIESARDEAPQKIALKPLLFQSQQNFFRIVG